ncbi:MAG: flagellar filament capping protein FliD [Sandaracinus sp.]|nr:flagellar filament capping protein FliD [Sandaracinus sp.]MCB9632489.1 flagellar filament capping protein FliD [Sandaracinus sp.]
MPVASFSGLASGIDTASLVSQLVSLERAPIKRLETKQANLLSMSRRFSEISKRVDALSSASEALVGATKLLGATASSTDESKVRVSATGDATLGGFSVEVRSLARAERTYSDGIAARDAAGLFGSGTLTLGIGTASTDVTVEATDTLDDVARKINESGAEVSASVLHDGTSYRLLLAGRGTGTTNAIEVTESGTSLGLDRPENELVAASDATVVIDGLEITRSSNRFADVVPGVTFDLRGETAPGETVGVEIDRDTDATMEKLEAFVSAYNEVTRGLDAEFAFAGAARIGNSLAGDSTLRGLQTRLMNTVLGEYSSTRLADLGIRLQNDGSLKLDDAEVRERLATDPDGLVSFFGADDGASGFAKALTDLADIYTGTDGQLKNRIDNLSQGQRDIDEQIERMERRIDKYEENMRKKFTAMEMVVSGLNSQASQLGAILTGLL